MLLVASWETGRDNKNNEPSLWQLTDDANEWEFS